MCIEGILIVKYKIPTRGLDLTGKTFHRLKVLYFVKGTGDWRGNLWKCQCDCGTKLDLPASSLKRGTTSCGCFKDELFETNRVVKKAYPNGLAAFNVLYYSYKKGAKRRNLTFNIDKSNFKKLTKQTCHYCGSKPNREVYSNSSKASSYTCNGVDRVDNEEGYSEDNCVACCKLCNNMKHAMGKKAFLKHVLAIAEHLNSRDCDIFDA